MVLKFCANLSFMFVTETGNLLERYQLASQAGFKAVECAFPYEYPLAEVIEAKTAAQVEQVLINVDPGDLNKGDLGLAALPGRENDFKASLEKSIEYALSLGCNKIHIMSGKKVPSMTETEMDRVYEENLKYAVKILESNNMVGLLEPISGFAVPNYYMNSFEKALGIIKRFNSDSLKLQLDTYHLQLLEGNLTNRMKELLPFTGHIQISQVPGRNEPNIPGELNYPYLLQLLEEYEYDGYIGLEYRPKTTSVESIGWIKEWGYNL